MGKRHIVHIRDQGDYLVANYKNPAFWKRGYQTLGASVAIFGVLIGRAPLSSAIAAYGKIDRSQTVSAPVNTQITEISKSPGITSPTKRISSVQHTSGATFYLPQMDNSWRLQYDSNKRK